MATNYPTSVDVFTNPAATDELDNPDHAAEHSNVNDAVHALETTLGVVGNYNFATLTGSQTLTNKTLTKRVYAYSAPGATPTIDTDTYDVVNMTALAAAITSMTTNLSGTPTSFQPLILGFTDNGTARAITWGTSFEASTVALPTTTVISTLLLVGFLYNPTTSKWRCVAVA